MRASAACGGSTTLLGLAEGDPNTASPFLSWATPMLVVRENPPAVGKAVRWVIHGNHQVKGVEYNKVYANTAKSGSIRLLLAFTATEGLTTAQLDAPNADIP